MALNDTAKNAMLDELGTLLLYVSLHTDTLGSGSGNEVTGGTPAYARKSITWSAASAGVLSASNAPVFDIPTTTTIRRVGFWSADTGGTYYGDGEITDETYSGQGTYTLSDADISITG
jgi:hypothetical protein